MRWPLRLACAHRVTVSRVGRRIELTDSGRMFLPEARGVLAKAASAELALAEYGGLKRGSLRLVASHTITAYWLPERLAAFHQRYPQIELELIASNALANHLY